MFQLRQNFRVGENLFDAGLGVVKVAPDGADGKVFPLLGSHLPLLHGADAVLRVKDQHPGACHVFKAFQSGLSRVAGGSHQHRDVLPRLRLFCGNRHEMGQKLKGHVLKGAGRAVPQLQKVGLLPYFGNFRNILGVKFFRRVGAFHALGQLFRGEIRQEIRKDGLGLFLIAFPHQGRKAF